jgi:hypothetical protein
VKLLTGNDLTSGAVIWWAGNGWSRHIGEAVDVGDKGEMLAKSEEAARRVNGAYLVEATEGPTGPVPLHIKEKIRASGPTVRPDLAIQPADQTAGSYVI